MGVTSLWLRLCAGETGGEMDDLLLLTPSLFELQSGLNRTLDLDPKFVADGLLSMSGMRPFGIFPKFERRARTPCAGVMGWV